MRHRPVLVACSHGTTDPEGQQVMAQLHGAITGLRADVELRAGYLEAQEPRLHDVVSELAAGGRRCIVVPLLLSAGFHLQADVAAAVASAAGMAAAATALGPDGALVDVLVERLQACGTGEDDLVLLAAAGSRDPRAQSDVARAAEDLAARLGRPVRACYLSAGRPSVPEALAEAVAAARDERRAVSVATYLLGPGHFARLLAGSARAAGTVRVRVRVSAPLAPHPELARLALRRFDDTLAALGSRA